MVDTDTKGTCHSDCIIGVLVYINGALRKKLLGHRAVAWLFWVVGYLQLVGGELYSKEVLLFSFCFL